LVSSFVPSAPHWANIYCFPLIIFLAATGCHSLRSALRLVPLIALQCLTDLVYVAPPVVASLGVLVVMWTMRRTRRASGLRLALALTVALLALLPVLRGYLAVRAANPNLGNQSMWKLVGDLRAVLPGQFLGGPWPLVVTRAAMATILVGGFSAVWRR